MEPCRCTALVERVNLASELEAMVRHPTEYMFGKTRVKHMDRWYLRSVENIKSRKNRIRKGETP
jgi:hypothetical protein